MISALRGQRVNQLHQCAAEDFGIIDAGLNSAQAGIAFADKACERLLTFGLLALSKKSRLLQSTNENLGQLIFENGLRWMIYSASQFLLHLLGSILTEH